MNCLFASADLREPLSIGFHSQSQRFESSSLAIGPQLAPPSGRDAFFSDIFPHLQRRTDSSMLPSMTMGGSSVMSNLVPISETTVVAFSIVHPTVKSAN